MDFPYQGVVSTPLIQELFPYLEPDEELLEEIPTLDQPSVTVITPRVDQICGRLFKYYQNFRVEGHSLVGAYPSVRKEAQEVHGVAPNIRWVSDKVAPGYHNSVRVDNVLYQVGEFFQDFQVFLHGCRLEILSLLSLRKAIARLEIVLPIRV